MAKGKNNKKNCAKGGAKDYPSVSPAHATDIFPPSSHFTFTCPTPITKIDLRSTIQSLKSTANDLAHAINKSTANYPKMDGVGKSFEAYQVKMLAFTEQVATEVEDLQARVLQAEKGVSDMKTLGREIKASSKDMSIRFEGDHAKLAGRVSALEESFVSKKEFTTLLQSLIESKDDNAVKKAVMELVNAELTAFKKDTASEMDGSALAGDVDALKEAYTTTKEEFTALEEKIVAMKTTVVNQKEFVATLEKTYAANYEEFAAALENTYVTKHELAEFVDTVAVAVKDEVTVRLQELALDQVKSNAKAQKKSFWSILGNVLDDFENDSGLGELFSPQGGLVTVVKEVGAEKGVDVEKIPIYKAGRNSNGGSGFCSVM